MAVEELTDIMEYDEAHYFGINDEIVLGGVITEMTEEAADVRFLLKALLTLTEKRRLTERICLSLAKSKLAKITTDNQFIL